MKGYKRINRVGECFGRLTITGYKNAEMQLQRKIAICKCVCGCETEVEESCLVSGNTKSCGCLKYEQNTGKGDGRSKERLYRVYHSMKQRCLNERCCNYKSYGLRGIAVCEEWLDSYLTFKTWAETTGYCEGLEIDRINNDGNYEPSNCRWVTRKINSNNKQKTVLITYKGETKPLTEWAVIFAIPLRRLRSRYQEQKMSFEDAINADKLYKKAIPII